MAGRSGLLRFAFEACCTACLTIKSLPPEQRRGWKAVFDYLIFQTDGAALEHLPPQARGLFGELTPGQGGAHPLAILLKNL